MLSVDITSKLEYELYAYFFRDFCNFIKSQGKNNIISYWKPLGDGHRCIFFTYQYDCGKELYNLLKIFLASRNVDIEEINTYYE